MLVWWSHGWPNSLELLGCPLLLVSKESFELRQHLKCQRHSCLLKAKLDPTGTRADYFRIFCWLWGFCSRPSAAFFFSLVTDLLGGFFSLKWLYVWEMWCCNSSPCTFAQKGHGDICLLVFQILLWQNYFALLSGAYVGAKLDASHPSFNFSSQNY